MIIAKGKATHLLDVAINKFILVKNNYILGGGRDGSFYALRIGEVFQSAISFEGWEDIIDIQPLMNE